MSPHPILVTASNKPWPSCEADMTPSAYEMPFSEIDLIGISGKTNDLNAMAYAQAKMYHLLALSEVGVDRLLDSYSS